MYSIIGRHHLDRWSPSISKLDQAPGHSVACAARYPNASRRYARYPPHLQGCHGSSVDPTVRDVQLLPASSAQHSTIALLTVAHRCELSKHEASPIFSFFKDFAEPQSSPNLSPLFGIVTLINRILVSLPARRDGPMHRVRAPWRMNVYCRTVNKSRDLQEWVPQEYSSCIIEWWGCLQILLRSRIKVSKAV